MNGKDSIHFSSKSSDWETPQNLFDKLNEEFNFFIDVCASSENNKCKAFYTKEMDALSMPRWTATIFEACFMNPPYGNPEYVCKKVCRKKTCAKRGYHNEVFKPGLIHFTQKAYDQSEYGIVVCLLPARTDTKTWSIFWDRKNHIPLPGIEVRFLKGRLKFGGAKDPAPFPSVVVVMDRRSDKAKTAKKKSSKKRG